MTQAIKAVAFDACGTLFDVYSVGALAETFFPGAGVRLSRLWWVAQIDYTGLRSLGERYVDFHEVTAEALGFAAEKLGIALDDDKRTALMTQYEQLTAFSEVREVLSSLKAKGLPLAILSNGTPDLLHKLVSRAGLDGLFDHLLSVDAIKRCKPAPQAYQIGPDALGCPASEIVFVSSNGWDVCGATLFGYRTFWVNRAGAPLEKLGARPAGEGQNLHELLAFIGA